MFSEFDNVNLFIDKLEDFKSNNWFSNEPLKIHITKTTLLFIDFLKEYKN